jgi:probable phosphoglycerate mutase
VYQAPDSPLSEKGRRQAESVAKRVSHLSFEVLIASHFQRAKETAETIAQATGKQAEYSELFVELRAPTSINGKPYENEKVSITGKEWQRSLHTSGLRVEDGENFDDLMARADKALEYLNNRSEESLVVVTHGYFLRTIIARVLFGNLLSEEAFKKFQKATSTENTGLTVLRYKSTLEEEPSWRLWIYNDHAHLG